MAEIIALLLEHPFASAGLMLVSSIAVVFASGGVLLMCMGFGLVIDEMRG